MARSTRSKPNIKLTELEPLIPLADLPAVKSKSKKSSSKKTSRTTRRTEPVETEPTTSRSRRATKSPSKSPARSKRTTSKSALNTIQSELTSVTDTIQNAKRTTTNKRSRQTIRTKATDVLNVIGKSITDTTTAIKQTSPVKAITKTIETVKNAVTPAKKQRQTKTKSKKSMELKPLLNTISSDVNALVQDAKTAVTQSIQHATQNISSTVQKGVRSVERTAGSVTHDIDALPTVTVAPSILLYIICLLISHIATYITYSDRMHTLYHTLVSYIPRHIITIDEYHHYNAVYYIVIPLYVFSTFAIRTSVRKLGYTKSVSNEYSRNITRIVYSIVTLSIVAVHYVIQPHALTSICESIVLHDFVFNVIELILHSHSDDVTISSITSQYITLFVEFYMLVSPISNKTFSFTSISPLFYNTLTVTILHRIVTELLKVSSYVIQSLNGLLYALYLILTTIGTFVLSTVVFGNTIILSNPSLTIVHNTVVICILLTNSFLSIIDYLAYKPVV